ncbi:hypothetical protein BDU57DRAFT_521238 [Ampelomyces quisqualis]|uniref:Uncharacterized protein n=1 Tax=Ampelomyces quisqualis TaxID=50730 RepID=A0A6A5QJ35_AMPQU|nr:hypothetical protein BDU57DRAFT_521238 [Ampelomyces quisqualis]
MSQNLFTKAPLLRTAARRSLPRAATANYSSTASNSAPKPQNLPTLIRQTTLRLSTTTLQRTSYPASQYFHTQSPRPRTPSPPPPYHHRGTTIRAPTDTWTRFSTPYTLSSIRTFTSSPSQPFASEAPSQLSPELQSRVDAVIEDISDLYGTAKDEFDIAFEESEKNSTYAADDRAAAREELDRLVAYYEGIVQGEEQGVAEEVRRRVGGRVRELVAGVQRMEDEVLHGDH